MLKTIVAREQKKLKGPVPGRRAVVLVVGCLDH